MPLHKYLPFFSEKSIEKYKKYIRVLVTCSKKLG